MRFSPRPLLRLRSSHRHAQHKSYRERERESSPSIFGSKGNFDRHPSEISSSCEFCRWIFRSIHSSCRRKDRYSGNNSPISLTDFAVELQSVYDIGWMNEWMNTRCHQNAFSLSLAIRLRRLCMMCRTKNRPKERRSLPAFGIQKKWDTTVINRYTSAAICCQQPLQPFVQLTGSGLFCCCCCLGNNDWPRLHVLFHLQALKNLPSM
jgi:hypothetical protein